jgi:multiple sugar transport system substrate-binding protein
MKKRYLAAMFAVMGGCGSGSDDPGNKPVTLKFLHHNNDSHTKADQAFFDQYKTSQPNVTVDTTVIDYPSLGSSLLADLKNDRLMYDMVRIQPSWVCSFAENLTDVPADVVSLSDAQNTFFAAPLAGSTCAGKLKALPIEYNLEYGGVVVNEDKYQAKFGKKPAWASWEGFIADATALSEFNGTTPAANGLDIAPDWPQPAKHIFFSQILQRGGQYWSATSPGTFDFNTPAAKQSLGAMVDWIKTGKIMWRSLIPSANSFVTTRLAKGDTTHGWNDVSKPLSVMGYAGTWALTGVISQIPNGVNTKYGFYTLPPMVGQEHKFVQNSGWAIGVPKTSMNQAAAWALIKKFLLSPDVMKQWARTTGALPALKANGTEAAAADDPILTKVQHLLPKGQWVGFIPAQAIEGVEGAIVSNFFAAAEGTKTVDQALVDMQTTANGELAKYK